MTQAYNPFAGTNEAPTFQNGSYLEPGRYKLKITKCIFKSLNAGGEAFIVECKVLESDNEKVKVGDDKSWFQKKNESFKSSVKLFALAAVGLDIKDEAQKDKVKSAEAASEAILLKAINENFLNGREVNCLVTQKDKKKTEGQFSLHTFSPAMPPMGG